MRKNQQKQRKNTPSLSLRAMEGLFSLSGLTVDYAPDGKSFTINKESWARMDRLSQHLKQGEESQTDTLARFHYYMETEAA